MRQKNKHIIFCTGGIFPYAVGGIQRHSLLLIEALAKTGKVDITVIHPHVGKRVFENTLSINEVAITFNHAQGNYLLNCYKFSKLVYAELVKHPEAIIYSQGLNVWYGATKIGKRLIYNPHGLEPFQGLTVKDKLTTQPFRLVLKKIFKNAAYVVSLGGKLTDILKKEAGVPDYKIVVLPNATNIPQRVEKKHNSNKTNFLFVGRFAHNKGIQLLLDCIKKLNSAGLQNKMHFNLVGKGPLYNKLTATYQLPNVSFAGFADNDKLHQMYSNNDVFVFPTLFEGMPTVVLEAMSYAMPVIVTDVGASAELVDTGNGILIQANNKTQLIDAIKTMTAMDIASRKRLAARALEKVNEKFTWQHVAQLHLQLFDKIKT